MFFGETIFVPLLVLMRRGAAPVKTNTGDNFPRKCQRNSQKLLPALVLKFGRISALWYCTSNFEDPNFWSLAAPGDPHVATTMRVKDAFESHSAKSKRNHAQHWSALKDCALSSQSTSDHGLASVSGCLYTLLMRPKQRNITPNLVTRP